jgi:HK97 family phage portal protein
VIIQSLGQLQALSPPASAWHMSRDSAGGLDLYTGSLQTYARIYETQPNVRIPVDFLARNVAQLGLPVFRRVSDTDRQRLPDHELAQWLERPNPATTRYRLVEDTVKDYLVYAHAYWLKVRSAPLALVRIPAGEMAIVGALIPTRFIWTTENGQAREFDPSEIVHFGAMRGISPLETLRRILAEEASAGQYRQQLWGNASRMEGVWEIAKDTPAAKWTDAQKKSWREQWQEFAGGGNKAGMTAVGPVGGSFKPISFSAKDAEFLAARKLTREECASAYHIPLPMVGILEHATYSNVREMRKMLYADCLGPTLEDLQAELERQLLPECVDTDRVYVEFNIAEKLKGSFEEQAASLQMAIGKPWMTANEGRALQNLPADDDPASDEIAAQQGGPATPATPGDEVVPFKPTPKPGAAAAIGPVLERHQARQQARLARVAVVDRPDAFRADRDRWDRELATDLAEAGHVDAQAFAVGTNADTLEQLEADATRARIHALEQRAPITVDVHPAAVTVQPPAITVHVAANKTIALTRDGTGAITGADVVSA